MSKLGCWSAPPARTWEAGEALSEVSAVTQRQLAFCRLKALVTCFHAASLLHGSLLG